jgi:hypothetical protein
MQLKVRHRVGHISGFCCIALMLFLTVRGSARAGTINAKSVSLIDVTTAINFAANGDTVILPAGSATWTGAVTVNKGISIIGAGKDVTVITTSKSGRADRRTFTILASAGQPIFRLSGLTIKGITSEGQTYNGVVYISGNAHQFRMNNLKFDSLPDSGIKTNGYLWGVIDHCDFVRVRQGVHFGHATWPAPNAVAATNGNGSWADDPYWGTEKFIFLEDCTYAGQVDYGGLTDGENGARFVVRHCVSDAKIQNHGTDSSGIPRGGRAVEIYENTLDATGVVGAPANPIYLRSGAALIHDNVFKGWTGNSTCIYFRGVNNFAVWGGANGTNVWDNNDSPVYESGTVSSANSSTTVVLPLSGLTENQYKGYVLRNTSSGNTLRFSTITGNTASSGGASTFTYMASAGYNESTMAFVGGDHFEIRKVMAGLDAPGRGKGDLLAGDLTTIHNTVTGTKSWPRNALEGIYFWNNHKDTATGSLAILGFGGIPKMGGGLFTTAKSGYTPYVYPHPLVSGAAAPPNPPTNLRVVPGG